MARSDSFQERLRPVKERLFGYALALTRDREKACDLFQECILRALAARDVPDRDTAFKGWLFAIMRNRWIDARRSEQRQEGRLRELDYLASKASPDLGSVVVNQIAVRQAFGALNLDHRDVLALVDISGFGYEETARLLSVPKGTVMSRVSRARRELCRLLSAPDVVVLRRSGRVGSD
jgi:RNA polymerase sigma-70 factor (ECF subfamily)